MEKREPELFSPEGLLEAAGAGGFFLEAGGLEASSRSLSLRQTLLGDFRIGDPQVEKIFLKAKVMLERVPRASGFSEAGEWVDQNKPRDLHDFIDTQVVSRLNGVEAGFFEECAKLLALQREETARRDGLKLAFSNKIEDEVEGDSEVIRLKFEIRQFEATKLELQQKIHNSEGGGQYWDPQRGVLWDQVEGISGRLKLAHEALRNRRDSLYQEREKLLESFLYVTEEREL